MIRRWRDRRQHGHTSATPPRPVGHRRQYRMSLASTWAAAKVVRRITVTLLTSWRVPPKSTVHDVAVFAVTELAANVVRHAAERSPYFELWLAVGDDGLEVAVRDGHPRLLDLPLPGPGGESGLAAVADLARHLGGDLTIEPAPEGGKTVRVRLPLDPPLNSPTTTVD
ncbi:ATP-binding protein [Kitasatospora sp. NPDC086791]|uniref:ATP-binding protein n=1 Tax=Kitasatospora sp. NPDC086791 TaxID=3155178 RepID=UPI0034498FD8